MPKYALKLKYCTRYNSKFYYKTIMCVGVQRKTSTWIRVVSERFMEEMRLDLYLAMDKS